MKIPAGPRLTAIAGGAEHSLALTRSGRLLAWGFNFAGELGTGTTTATLMNHHRPGSRPRSCLYLNRSRSDHEGRRD